MRNTFMQLSASLFLGLMISACGGGGGSSSAPAPTPATPPIASSASSEASSSNSTSNAASKSSTASSSPTASSENQILAEYHSTHTVYNLENCGQGISSAEKTSALFADYDSATKNQLLNGITGWNHVTNGSATEWKNIKLAATDYNNPNSGKANGDCNNVDTLNMVLVKKYADWDHQHANGFEHHIATKNITFGNVDSIVIDLKINSARTTIPTQKNLLDTYSTHTGENSIKGVDANKVNIGFTLYDGTSLNAADIIEIDQSLYGDKWIRVVIKMDSINYYSETNYVRTAKKPEDLASAVIKGLLVVGETKTGNVLRGNISNWSTNVPETFKEMDISFKKIEFLLK